MDANIPYLVAPDAIPPLLEFCARMESKRYFLVADPNTYRVLGQRTEASLREAGHDVKLILLTGDEISTDEHYVTQAMIETNGEDRQFIAVGSGTITDITRFISHRARASFISLPTAHRLMVLHQQWRPWWSRSTKAQSRPNRPSQFSPTYPRCKPPQVR